MSPSTAPHGEKSQTLARQLRAMILSGQLEPGARLVEADLTAQLGSSRGALREAFRSLAAEGLVELVPNKGAAVRRLSRGMVLDLLEIRIELEALALRRAIARLRDPSVRVTFETDIDPAETGDQARNSAFHAAILQASGSPALIEAHGRLQLALILPMIARAADPGAIEASMAEHRRIAAAALSGTASLAEMVLRSHLRKTIDMVEALPEGIFSPG